MADGFDPAAAIDAAAAKYGVDPALAHAIAMQGEGFGHYLGPTARSPKGALGPMQLMPETAQGLGVDPTDPAQNVDGGVRLISQLATKYHGDTALVAAAYNSGAGAVDRHGGVPPYRETQAYVERVTQAADPTQNMPSPDQVLGGYGQKGGAPAAAAGGDPTTDPGSVDAMPDPKDVLSNYGAAKPGSGSVTSGADKQPVNAAVEAAVRARMAAGLYDPKAPPGSDLNPYDYRPGAPPPEGAAHYDQYGNFVPSTPKPGEVKPPTDPSYGTDSANVGNPLTNFFRDWKTRADEGNAGISGYADRANNPTATDSVIHAMGLPTLNDAKGAGAVLGVATAPFMAGYDQVVGRPLAVVANRVNDTTGVAPGYVANPHAISDVASVVSPLADAAVANRAIQTGAKAAGMSESGYVAGQQAAQRGSNIAAADAKAAQGPGVVTRTFNAITGKAAPFVAGVSDAAAEKQAGQFLTSKASDPATVRSVLGDGPSEIVPGAKPTTFQATGDMGLGSVERGYAARFPEQARQVAADQNNARVAALQGVQTGGDPMDVTKAIRGQFDALDAQHEAAVASATQAAQDAAQAAGGHGNPEDYGAALRQNVQDAADASKAQYQSLYKAVDPSGTMVMDASPVAQGASAIRGEVPPTAKPISGEEADVFNVAAGLGAQTPFKDVTALRIRVGDAITAAKIAGDNTAVARLTRLKGSIDDALAGRVAEQVTSDQAAVAAGQMAPEQSTLANLNNWVSDWYGQRAVARAGGDAGGAPSRGGSPGSGSATPAGVPGAAGPSGGASGGATGNPGVPGQPGPTAFDPAAADRLKAANAAFAQHQNTFGLKPVGAAFARDAHGSPTLPDGSVPAKFFHPGPSGFTDMQALIKANPDAMPVIEDYAAMSLKRTAMNEDGTIDPAKFVRWQKANADAIRALPPETQARFADAATAGDAVGQAQAARAEALKSAQQGVAGKLLGVSDPEAVVKTVATALNGRTAVSDMAALAERVRGNPEAESGLRQAVMDHILGRFMGNAEAATTGESTLKADAFQTFLKQNRTALSKVFNPEEMAVLDNTAASLRQSRRSNDAVKLPGSNTIQDKYASAGTPGGKGGGHALINIVGTGLGGLLGIGHGAGGAVEGSMLGGLTAEMLQGLRAKGIAKVDDLVRQAVFDPEVARRLFAKVPTDGTGKIAPKVLNARFNALLAALGASADLPNQKSQPTAPRNAMAPTPQRPVVLPAMPNAMVPQGPIQ